MTHLKRRETMSNVDSTVITMLKDMEIRIPLMILGKIDMKSMNQAMIDYFSLAIKMSMKDNGEI